MVRIRLFERVRRRELLTPAVLAMIALTISGYLPATRPLFVPIMAGALTVVIAIFVAALLLNRANRVEAAAALYVLGLLIFYGLALFITPTGAHGELAFTGFTAGNLYYFLADVLPIFASTLLLDMPWPIIVSIVVFVMNMACIYVLPHDATFAHFVDGLGGSIFLAASVTLGQVVLIVFGIAAARAIRRALYAASRAVDIEEINRRIEERQRALEMDVRVLQETHARIANGEPLHANLTNSSELYPVAISLNLMVDRVSRLSGSDQELRRIERGLNEASAVVAGMGRGDLSVRPRPTGTMVDGLMSSLIQVQGQVSTWVQQIGRALRETSGAQSRSVEVASDLALSLRSLRDLANADALGPEASDVLALAQANAEQLLQSLQALQQRERTMRENVERISIGAAQ